jgi:hypothetical protein
VFKRNDAMLEVLEIEAFAAKRILTTRYARLARRHKPGLVPAI